MYGPLEYGTTFVNEREKRVGNLRGQNTVHQGRGLGLMRIEECSKAEKIRIKTLAHLDEEEETIKVYVTKPDWWPQEAPKSARGL